jgi:molybdate transport system regulatory protein
MFTGHTEICITENGGSFIVRNIVVAAAGRKLGKTLLCTELVRLLHDSGYSIAYCKLARHGSAGTQILSGPGRDNSDTWRIHAAGASEVCILKYGSLSDIQGKLPYTDSEHDVVVWETNSAASLFTDSTLIYIEGKLSQPKNPELSDVADVLVTGPFESVPPEIAGLALSVAGLPGFNPVYPGWKLWLESGGNPVFGRGVASLLEAIRDSGSILSASKAAGIQYRRVWTLVSNTEKKLGMKLIRRNRGGSGGGGSSLTPVAVMLLEKYHFLEKAMADAARRLEERN